MKVTVRLFATFREGRGKEVSIDAEKGVTSGALAATLGIAREEIAILLVNGRDGKLDAPLADGDTVSLFPPVGGG